MKKIDGLKSGFDLGFPERSLRRTFLTTYTRIWPISLPLHNYIEDLNETIFQRP
jgi:hypothetical protein